MRLDRGRFPHACVTPGDSAREVAGLSYGHLVERGAAHREQDLWAALLEVLIEHSLIARTAITPETFCCRGKCAPNGGLPQWLRRHRLEAVFDDASLGFAYELEWKPQSVERCSVGAARSWQSPAPLKIIISASGLEFNGIHRFGLSRRRLQWDRLSRVSSPSFNGRPCLSCVWSSL